jgi:hypothetical protein
MAKLRPRMSQDRWARTFRVHHVDKLDLVVVIEVDLVVVVMAVAEVVVVVMAVAEVVVVDMAAVVVNEVDMEVADPIKAMAQTHAHTYMVRYARNTNIAISYATKP